VPGTRAHTQPFSLGADAQAFLQWTHAPWLENAFLLGKTSMEVHGMRPAKENPTG